MRLGGARDTGSAEGLLRAGHARPGRAVVSGSVVLDLLSVGMALLGAVRVYAQLWRVLP